MSNIAVSNLPFRVALCSSLVAFLASCGGGSAPGATTTGISVATPASTDLAKTSGLQAANPGLSSAGGAHVSGSGAPVPPAGADASNPAVVVDGGTNADRPATPGPYGHDASQYLLAFHDEFAGTAVDSTKWTDHIWYDQPTSTEDYGVNGGSLKIWPQRNAAGKFAERILVTDKKYYQTYGYFEMEAKLPVGSGTWPAFWLLNSDSPNSGEPEIDIMEAYAGDTTGYWGNADKHPIRYGATFFENGANFPGLQKTEAPSTGDLSSGFHKYAVKWEPNKLSFYFDGKLVSSSDVTMSKRMYLLLDMQYGSASGAPDETTPTGPSNAFEVHYVRTWRFKD